MRTESRTKNAMLFASTFAIVDLVVLFLGPIIFTPQANQGPLLGVLLFVPAFILGGIVGAIIKPKSKG